MIKKITTFKLKEGADPEMVWKLWSGEHAQIIKTFSPLKRYVVNRVIKVINGEPSFWGEMEVWYESEEAFKKAAHDMDRIKEEIKDNFNDYISDIVATWVEEKVILEYESN